MRDGDGEMEMRYGEAYPSESMDVVQDNLKRRE